MTVKFHYNDIDSLKSLFERYPGKIACVLLEPATVQEPMDRFLHQVQDLCKKEGSVFVLDEMITGFRWNLGGAQKYYDIVPDLSTFGKAMANGFSVSALVGKKELMNLGGILQEGPRVFLLSTTHGAENHALAAAIATMRIYRQESVVEYLNRQGTRLIAGIRELIEKHQMGPYFEVIGMPCNLVYVTRDREGKPSQSFRTLFLQEMIRQGFLVPSLVVSFSHSNDDIDRTILAIGEVLQLYKLALEEGVGKYLEGRSVKPVNRKFN